MLYLPSKTAIARVDLNCARQDPNTGYFNRLIILSGVPTQVGKCLIYLHMLLCFGFSYLLQCDHAPYSIVVISVIMFVVHYLLRIYV